MGWCRNELSELDLSENDSAWGLCFLLWVSGEERSERESIREREIESRFWNFSRLL